jgi:hypothetical protein
LDKARRSAIARAVQDYGGLVGWRANLEKVTRNRFLMGRVPPKAGFKQFRATIDWFIQPATVRKVIEDFYEADYFPQAVQSIAKQIAPSDEWSRWMRDYRGRMSFWPASLGPRPEEPNCRAPTAMLEACRQRLGIVVAVPEKLTREQRMEASIVSYRNAGRYEDANRVERLLAQAQGRAPVEVPAPDARDPDVLPQMNAEKVTRSPPSNDDLRRRAAKKHADQVQARIAGKSEEPPPWTEIPESEYEVVDDGN